MLRYNSESVRAQLRTIAGGRWRQLQRVDRLLQAVRVQEVQHTRFASVSLPLDKGAPEKLSRRSRRHWRRGRRWNQGCHQSRFREVNLPALVRARERGGGRGWMYVGDTSFSHELGDAFQIFCCGGFWASLIIVVIDAPTGPVMAVEVFRSGVVAADVTMTRAIVVVLARLGLLIARRLSDVTLVPAQRASPGTRETTMYTLC